MLFVICWLLCVGCSLLFFLKTAVVVCYSQYSSLLVVCRALLVVRCWLLADGLGLSVVGCSSLEIVWFGVLCSSLFVVSCGSSWFAVVCCLFVVA